MKIELNVQDRLTILSILPSTGNIVDLVEIMDLIKEIKLTDEEKTKINFIQDNNVIRWDVTQDLLKEFNINSSQIQILKNTVKTLDLEKKINLSMLNTCIKINNL